MKDWCRPGQVVACISDDWQQGGVRYPHIAAPAKDQVYTIRGTGAEPCLCNPAGQHVYITLVEVVNRKAECARCQRFGEVRFHSDHFRPVRDTSIESLRGLLSPGPGDTPAQRELEDA